MKKTNLKKRWIGFAAASVSCLVIGLCLSACSQKIEESVLKSEATEEQSGTAKEKDASSISSGKEKTAEKDKTTVVPDKKEQKKSEPSGKSAVKDDKDAAVDSKEKAEQSASVKKIEKPEKTDDQKPENNESQDPKNTEDQEKTEEPAQVKEPDTPVQTPEPAKEEHHHAYYVVGETAPTCTSAGKRTYACSCGLTYDDSIPMTDHNWIPVIEIRHHDAEVKAAWDEVVSEAWDEPVYESHSFCNGCGIDLDELEASGTDRGDHIWDEHDGMNGWHDENVQVDTIHHDAETVHHPEEVISPAWDEEIVTGYVCSVCGTAK